MTDVSIVPSDAATVPLVHNQINSGCGYSSYSTTNDESDDDRDDGNDRCYLQNVFFRFVDGKTFCLMVHPLLDNVATIKRRLITTTTACSNHTANNDIYFIWNGKPLDDQKYLLDYGMMACRRRHHHHQQQRQQQRQHYQPPTIFVNYRLRGGCFIVSFTILMIIIIAVIGSFCTCGLSLVVIPFLLPLLFVLPLFCL